ncbi:ATP-binding protein [Mucilaginibacter gilvus]|uniref:ATP-binding protein n=1 Tax=Mucilaginibacter gilvus TaxID=2305909 RepID=UPI0014199971|nr:ATP-binding protein [Mucilaginibacter gilvus]
MIENTFGMNIIPDNDIERLSALKRYRIMDTPSEASFDNIAKLCTQIFNVPISLVSLVDAERVFFKANVGMGNAKEANRGKSLCALAVLSDDVTVFEDALKEPCLMANPNVAGDFGLRFYAGAPLITYDGFLIGTLCIIDKKARSFSEKEKTILAGMATAIMDQVELRLSALDEIDKHLGLSKQADEQREEIYAMNEELTATNEELRESQEELIASANSLANVNEELAASNEELVVSQIELQNSIEEIEASAETLRMITDNMPQLAWMADGTGSIYWYSQRWFDYTGTTLSDMVGWGWQKVHHPDHVQRVTEKVSYHFNNGIVWEDIFPLKGSDGEYRWFLSRAIPSKNEKGEVIRWFGTNTDITDQRKLEQQKDDFLSIASHELKTPITSLKASLQLLDKIKDKEYSSMHIRLIEQSNRSMEKMSVLVDELLNIHRLTDGHLHLNKTTFTIAEMLDLCCNHVRVAGKHELVFSGDKDLQIHADEHRVDQVVVNFVNNAVKYAPDSKEIYLIVEKLDGFAKVSVKDTGPGIAPEKLPYIFDRYYRADHSGQAYNGLGLGLYISAEIIKKHDGQIGVESELGKGSTFWFTLPR